MKFAPGSWVTLYYFTENADKVEGRGPSLGESWFEREEDAKAQAQGKGSMGYEAHVFCRKFLVDDQGRLWTAVGQGPRVETIFKAETGDKVRAALGKLTAEERDALRKAGLLT